MATRHCMFLRFTAAASLTLVVLSAHSQIATDGSVGSAQSLAGPNYAIGAGLGTQRGANLFHSFSTFNINTGESATFTGPSGLQNVISRVTGGALSSIDGTLRSEINGANVWLINPAGVVFGANAKLDVPAAFHVSTADELRFTDGAKFSAANPGVSTLSAAPIAAFGFTSAAPKRIEANGGFLSVKEGQTLSLVGGDINLSNVTIYAPAGRLNIASVGSAGEVALTETDVELRGFEALGRLTMMRDPDVKRVTVDGDIPLGDLDTSGESGGAMFIRGGNWLNQGGWVFAHTYGTQARQGIDVAVTGDLTLLNGGHISTATVAQGDAGAVTISAGNLLVDGQGSKFITGIFSRVYSTGSGGNVNLAVVETLSVLNGGEIRASTYGQGDAGAVTISAGNLLADGQGSAYVTGLVSDARPGSTGAGGNVTLDIADTLTVQNGGEIHASTYGQGDAGAVTISAGNLLVDGQGSAYVTGLISETESDATGDGGSINLTIADTLTVQNGGDISARTWGMGNAGSVTVTARNLLVDGYQAAITADGQIQINVIDTIRLQNKGGIYSGNGGDITISTSSLLMNGKSSIFAWTSDEYNGGDITISTHNLLMDSESYISAFTFDKYNGGDITISASNLLMNGESSIDSGTIDEGNAGDITISTSNLLMNGESRIYSGTASNGLGGHIQINVTDTLTLQNQSSIKTRATDVGDGGDVAISAGNLLIDDGKISTSLLIDDDLDIAGGGNAGNITIAVADTLTIRNGGTIDSSVIAAKGATAVGNPGNIFISTGNLLVDGQGSESLFTGIFTEFRSFDIDSDSGENKNTITAGNIGIAVADSLLLFNGGAISTSTWSSRDDPYISNAGNINITAHNLLINSNFSSYGGIRSAAELDGQAGTITIVTDTLSLFNDSVIKADSARSSNSDNGIHITARHLELSDSGILARSVEGDAGFINLQIGDRLILDESSISTESYDGKGGNITLNGGNLLLHNSRITTSVEGERGDGGDITLNPYTLVLDSGFIQANTTGANAKGGAIQINTEALLSPADQQLRIGGPEREIPQPLELVIPGVNVIQAAAPQGESGTLDVTTPDLNLSGALAGTSNRYSDLNDANQDPCARRKGQKKSTLTKVGRGGLPADNRPEGMTVSLSGGDWTAEPVEPAPSLQEPLALNADRDDCRL